ncbi:aldehyde dehydrogenase family protein [Planotetraspora sp. A-T 1434]|uniref:aldehyde dehydrogenase family protein n=1 Tax=Planotetraspora sp. A-T 1434 TaxID=2979219 RepID=UPI0021C22A12|nr:aldehyde dehydrogenase family protein [Planotetraspora sp. A-T 1434]MCT9933624.1 aldehyde dehydrogenase family protein [Planotetraspora sp. A-T 1434]
MQFVSQHFINGRFVDSHGQDTIDIHNPATGELIGRSTLGDAVDAERAIAAAKAAFPAWSTTSLDERRQYLQRIADALTERMDDLVAMTVAEYGAPAFFAGYIDGQARDFFVLVQDLLKPETFEETNGNATITKVPVGVAGLLTPWNGNPWFVCGKTASALAAGCTVVIKPSELSPLEAQILMECFEKAALPPGVINVVIGPGATVGNAITRSPDVQKISFTGSTRIGKQINHDATETMKRVTLELGGKSPTIVLDDADMEHAIGFALGAGLMNTGQACIAGTRILVPESRFDEAKTAIKAGVEALKIGDQIQPMVSAGHYERVQGYIRKGIEEGAEVLVGGEGKPAGFEAGNYVKPTVFTNVTNDMTIAQEEIFGPVLSVITYRDDDEAVAIANDVEYGLHAYVYGQDQERARKVANRILAGRVMINQIVDDPTSPFGGFKMSGFGREFGIHGLQAYLETRTVYAS